MRILPAVAVALFVSSLGSTLPAQSLGDLAAREKEKRKGKPAPKVITETDLARVGTRGTYSAGGASEDSAVPGEPAPPEAGVAAPPVEGQNPDVVPGSGTEPGAREVGEAGVKPPELPQVTPAKKEKSEEEIRAERMAEWRKKLDLAREKVRVADANIAKIQQDLNDVTGGIYGQRRNEVLKMLEEQKQAAAKGQAEVASLEDEGRRNAWRY